MNAIQEELMLGLEAQQNQQFEAAAACYQRILSEEPEHPETNHAIGLLLIENNQLTDAIPFLAKALERRPEVDHLWFDCIDAIIGTDNWDHAASLIERAREAGLPAEELDLRDLRVLHGVTERNLAKSA
jgi:predicted Zn-dependent protease